METFRTFYMKSALSECRKSQPTLMTPPLFSSPTAPPLLVVVIDQLWTLFLFPSFYFPSWPQWYLLRIILWPLTHRELAFTTHIKIPFFKKLIACRSNVVVCQPALLSWVGGQREYSHFFVRGSSILTNYILPAPYYLVRISFLLLLTKKKWKSQCSRLYSNLHRGAFFKI